MNEKTKLVKEKTGMNIKDLTCALRGHYQMGYPLAKILAQKTGMSPLYFLEN